jgi:hypothetical protein
MDSGTINTIAQLALLATRGPILDTPYTLEFEDGKAALAPSRAKLLGEVIP